MIILSLIAALLAAAQSPTPALEAPVKVKMTCPIGGASFDYLRPAPSTPVGMRPDGKPYGTGKYPPALPECPDNGLTMYKDYNPAEVEKLTPLVASDEYQALRSGDTAYYRAYWLMKALGESPDDYLWALLQASWEADGQPLLRARYLAELAEAAAAIPARPQDVEWIGMEGRAINALRELGRFDEAKARQAALPLTSLDSTLVEAGIASEEEAKVAKARQVWMAYFKALRPVIERQDKSTEPFDMIPRAIAVRYCIDRPDAWDDQQRSFCKAEAAAVEELRTARTVRSNDTEMLAKPRTR